jgi:ribosomal protein L37E
MVNPMTLREMKKLKGKVYLHCESCGEKLYEVNKDKLRSPMLASMFLPVAGVQVCWPSRYGQGEMTCPRCGYTPMRTWNEITVDHGRGLRSHIKLSANRPILLEDNKAECPLCGVVKDRRGIKTHILHCKGEANE